MSLVAYIGDTHIGAGNSNNMFLKYQKEYFKNIVQDFIKLGVTDVFHAGDLYDVRKSINFKTLRESGSFFRDQMLNAPFNTHILVGNHDSYHKNSLKINAVRELLDWTPFKIYDEPEEIVVDSCKILMMPWICKDNEEKSYKMIDESFASICIGHFDIAGFGMSKEVINHAGMSRSIFNKFDRTFSGHFHLPSEQDNIIYIGSPYQLTWSDYGDSKRVILHDTKTNSLRYLENKKSIFEKIHYKENIELKEGEYTDKILKIYAEDAHNAYKFDQFVRRVQEQNPYSISIIDSIKFNEDENTETSNMTKDTMQFLVECVDAMEVEKGDKDSVKELMLRLYSKAQEVL